MHCGKFCSLLWGLEERHLNNLCSILMGQNLRRALTVELLRVERMQVGLTVLPLVE